MNDMEMQDQMDQRKRIMMAQMLQGQGQGGGQMVGKHYIAPSPVNQMANLLGAYLGRQQPVQINQQQTQDAISGKLY